jgi:hypothetical protein
MKTPSRPKSRSHRLAISRASNTSRVPYRAVSAAPVLNIFFAAAPHFARSHSMPSTFTRVGMPRALSRGSQKPLATFITRATSGFRRRASTLAVSPYDSVLRDLVSKPRVTRETTRGSRPGSSVLNAPLRP